MNPILETVVLISIVLLSGAVGHNLKEPVTVYETERIYICYKQTMKDIQGVWHPVECPWENDK